MLAQTNCKVNRRLVDSVYFIDNFAETKFIIFVENPYLAAVIAPDRTYHGEALKAYIAEAIDASDPNLVMFLGDNIMSPEDGTVESYWSWNGRENITA